MPEGSQGKYLIVAIYSMNLTIASAHIFPYLLTKIAIDIIIVTFLMKISVFMLR